jgi:hypothetical protein
MGGFTRVSWAGRARRRASDLSPPSHAVACTLSAAHRIRVAQRCSASSHRASATPPTRTVRSDSTPSARGVLGSEPPARLWRPLAAAAGRAAAPAVGGCGQGLQQVVGRARTPPRPPPLPCKAAGSSRAPPRPMPRRRAAHLQAGPRRWRRLPARAAAPPPLAGCRRRRGRRPDGRRSPRWRAPARWARCLRAEGGGRGTPGCSVSRRGRWGGRGLRGWCGLSGNRAALWTPASAGGCQGGGGTGRPSSCRPATADGCRGGQRCQGGGAAAARRACRRTCHVELLHGRGQLLLSCVHAAAGHALRRSGGLRGHGVREPEPRQQLAPRVLLKQHRQEGPGLRLLLRAGGGALLLLGAAEAGQLALVAAADGALEGLGAGHQVAVGDHLQGRRPGGGG